MKAIKRPAATLMTTHERYSARFILGLSAIAVLIGLAGFLLISGDKTSAHPSSVESALPEPQATEYVSIEDRNLTASGQVECEPERPARGEIRVQKRVNFINQVFVRALIPESTASTVLIIFSGTQGSRPYRNPIGCTGAEFGTVGNATITLPPLLKFHSLFSFPQGVTVSGQTITYNFTNRNSDPWTIGVNVTVPALADLPDTPPSAIITSSGSFTFPTLGTRNFATSETVALLYSKPRVSSTTTGPVAPGDEVDFRLEIPSYPHHSIISSKATISLPTGTELVPGSLTDTAGATVSTPSSDRILLDWGSSSPAVSLSYRIKVLPGFPPDRKEIYQAPTHSLKIEHSRPDNLSPLQYEIAGVTAGISIPVEPNLEIQLDADVKNVNLEQEFTLKARLKNVSSHLQLTNIELYAVGITYSGEGLAELVNSPPAASQLGPLQSVELEYRFKAKRAGKFKISGKGIATAVGRQFLSDPATSPELCVGCSDVVLSIDIPATRLKVGDQFPAVVKVTSNLPDPTIITFADPLLKERPFSGVAIDAILKLEPHALPTPFELTAANRTRSFTVIVKVNKLGTTELVSSLSYTKAGVAPITITTAKKVSTPPFDVTVEITPKQAIYNQTPAVKKTERCRALEAASPITIDPVTGAEVREVANCIEITVKVKNSSEKTISNVNIPDAATPLKLINETDPKIPGEPLKEIEHVFPAAPVNLIAGAEATWIWRLNAFDAPAFLEFEPTVFGVMNGQEVSGHATKEFKILKNVLLKWGMRPTQGRTDYPSGAPVRADGYLENLSMKDGGEKKLLRVMLYQMVKKNMGGGFVFDVLKAGQTPAGPETYQIFDVEGEGDLKRINLGSVFRTMRMAHATTGEIRFGIRMWIVETDGKLTPATDQAQLDDENYTDEINIFLAPEQVIPDVFKEQCLATGFRPIICSFNEGLYGEAVPGMYGLLQFAYTGLEGTGEGIARMGVYNARILREYMNAAMGDPEARRFIMEEAYQTYKTYYDLGVMAGQVPGQAAMGFEAFSIQTVGGIDKYLRAIDEGDITAVEEMTGHFFGANPDLLLEPLAVARSYAVMARSLKKAGTGIADNVVTAAARNKAIKEQAEVDVRVAAAKANPNVSDLSSALASGDELSGRLLVQVFGVDEKTLKRIHDFAKKNKVILAFRSRSDIAQSLLNRNLAWPKPQALKHKTVNEIDTKYLGYRNESKGILEIVEPPAGIAGKTDETGLKEALDEHMAKLGREHPELQNNHVLRFEVRERLKTRAEEWTKYCPQLGVGDAPKTVDIGVSFEANLQWARDVSGDIGPKEYRKVTTKPDGTVTDATGESRRVWTLDMEGPNGQPARSVTGDIDFLAFLDERGLMIQDDDKLIALYKQMSEMGLMEHGESMSFRLNDARLKHLECCIDGVPGSEAMMTVGPWDGPPRAGRFVQNLTVMNELNSKFRRFNKTETIRDEAGKIEYDDKGKPKTVTIRHENTNGEFVLLNGPPLLNYADDAFVAHFIPLLLDDVYAEFKSRIKYYFPGLIARLLAGEEPGQYRSSAEPQASIFRRGGPVLQLEPVSEIDLVRPDKLRVWTRGAGWQPITREAAIAAGEPGVHDMAPNTVLSEGAVAGSDKLIVIPAAELEMTGDFISPSDIIVINPGGGNQEIATVLSINPIVLTAPLTAEHEAGEMIAVIDRVPTASVSGRVTTPNGLGLRNAVVTLTDSQGVRRTATTSSFGVYSFVNVRSGETYLMAVSSKRYRFAARSLAVNSDLANVDFAGLE